MVPYISGEEDKLETETLKILGSLSPNQTEFLNVACMKVSAHCNRVAVLDGHTATVSISFASRPPPTPEQVVEVLRAYKCEAQTIGAPSGNYVEEEWVNWKLNHPHSPPSGNRCS